MLCQVGGLIKRLDTGEGSCAKELEEDYDVAEQLDQVLSITLSSIQTCEDFKGQFMKYDYLWKQDLNQALQVMTGWQCGCCFAQEACAADDMLLTLPP